jgi:hypothetical protein
MHSQSKFQTNTRGRNTGVEGSMYLSSPTLRFPTRATPQEATHTRVREDEGGVGPRIADPAENLTVLACTRQSRNNQTHAQNKHETRRTPAPLNTRKPQRKPQRVDPPATSSSPDPASSLAHASLLHDLETSKVALMGQLLDARVRKCRNPPPLDFVKVVV